MMFLRLLFLLATVSILVPIGSNIAFGQQDLVPPAPTNQAPPPPGDFPPPPPPNGNPEPPWAKDLNLSNQQREQIKAIHEQERKDTEALREQLKAADEQLRSLLDSDASAEKLRQQHQQIQKLRQQLDDKHFETILAERQVLTAEQRAQLAKLQQQRRPRE